MKYRVVSITILLVATLAVAACAAIRPARMERPQALAGVEPQAITGLGGGTSGTFRVGALGGRFERRASRLELFDRLAQDRAAASYTLDGDGVRADCRLSATAVGAGVVQVPVKPAGYACSFSRAGQALAQRLEWQAVAAAAGTRDERRGRYESGEVTLELQSVHRLQGSALPTTAPVGYVFLHAGQPVAALDLADSTNPLLWSAVAGAPLAQAVVQSALALALLWDPAGH